MLNNLPAYTCKLKSEMIIASNQITGGLIYASLLVGLLRRVTGMIG